MWVYDEVRSNFMFVEWEIFLIEDDVVNVFLVMTRRKFIINFWLMCLMYECFDIELFFICYCE